MSVVTATILSAGKSMDPSFEMVSIDVVKEVNRIPYAILTLLDGSAVEQKFVISDDAFFEPGKEIELKLRYEGAPQSEASVFKGLVVKQTIEANERGTLLTVELKDEAIKLSQTRHSEIYRKKTDDQIMGDLIDKNGVKKGSIDATQPEHLEIVQYYCTDWDFILSRADLYGLWVIANDGEISVRKIDLSGEARHNFEFGISDIFTFEIEVDGSHQYASVESIAWDLKKQKLTQSIKAKEFNLSQGNLNPETVARAVGGQEQSLSSAVPMDAKGLQAWADGAMIKSRMSMIRGFISVPGFGDVKRLDLMNITGMGKRFNGKTIVTGIRHRVNQNGWRTDVQFGLSAERFITRPGVADAPAAGHLPGINGLHIGVVDQFAEDPDKEFRVKVFLPSFGEKKNPVWARLATPDAGKERGYFFRPEPGDEVVMGFFNDDPRQAVILGALYGSKNVPPKKMKLAKENLDKGIVSKKGTTLGFIDDEKPTFFVETPGANKLIVDDNDQKILISDQHGNSITMSKDGIEIKSTKDLKIESTGNVEIKGTKVDIK